MTVKDLKGNEIARFADVAMYEAEDMPFDVNEVGPQVTLLQATPDPLGAVAAMSMMYEGKVVRNLNDLTNVQRSHYFEQIMKTHLKAPFESVQLHFLIEGVTRSFTHQMVRQRTAVLAQESLRFAVKDTIDEEVALPPSLRGLKKDDPRVVLWKTAVNKTDDVYHALIDGGIPAEDARGLLPHNITTRLHYVTNLRALQDHAGMRLCTQAQFEWRTVWVRMVEAIRKYRPIEQKDTRDRVVMGDGWQFETMADMFRPICYQTGKCEFKASFDRKCSIRDRVEANHKKGRPSSEWAESNRLGEVLQIRAEEWLLDSKAAR